MGQFSAKCAIICLWLMIAPAEAAAPTGASLDLQLIPTAREAGPVGRSLNFGRVIEVASSEKELKTLQVRHGSTLFSITQKRKAELRFEQAALADGVPAEGYRLTIVGEYIRIKASTPQGRFYGLQTLLQLIHRSPQGDILLPEIEITDAPRFAWRGVLLDVSRHFFGKETVLRLIDEMARYKLNVLHLHLTDDAGWRLEIPGYPKLTEIGARGDREAPGTGEARYYTADDIRQIVAYAADRHVMVIPEIDMPGHSAAAARAYPEFFDGNKTFNPAREESYTFIRAVFAEVARLFPAPYIHYGGDEVRQENWSTMPDVQALQQREGLHGKEGVEGYFGKRVAGIIRSLGKRPMAWDEQVSAGADKDVQIQWWRKYQPEVRDAAVRAGYDVILSPADQTYFDYPQGPGEPGALWEGNDDGPISLAKILAWEPIPASYTADEAARVKGVEAALWTEFIRSEDYLEYMAFPRLLAFAEVAWGQQRGPRKLDEFNTRLAPHITALRERGINARRDESDASPWVTH